MFQNNTVSPFKLFLFGPPRLEQDGEPVDISLRKALALLVYLAVTGQSHSRDALATLFWPNDSQSKARANLRRVLSILKKALGENQLEIGRERAGLNSMTNRWLDVDHFQRCLAECQTHDHPANEVCPDCLPLLTEAASYYTDDFLAGFTLPDCPDFDEWQFFQSESLRQELTFALERLVQDHSAQGDYQLAISYARRWLALDPLHEPAHRQLMELYAHTGQQTTAVRQYQECVRILGEEFGAPPSEETTALYEVIRTKRVPSQVSQARVISPLPPRPPAPLLNLPLQLTPFIGREAELAALDDLIADPDVRLVTIVGPGGMGKTRLSIQAATESLDAFADGVCFVSLAPITGADYLPSAIAHALNLKFFGGKPPQEQLLNHLRDQQLLLLLDNFEHVLAGSNVLSEILLTAPQVKLLVTSRERLGLQREWVYELRGMAYPPPPQPSPFEGEGVHASGREGVENYSALQLFEQRARQTQATFDMTTEYPSVARICQLVNGMPLALELAASWINLMSCREIAAEIEQNLDFLTTSMRDVPERHRSLRAVFEHSWQLLSSEEKEVFKKLSVFRGGFSRPAAESITGATLQILMTLVNKSLVQPNYTGRYHIHELLRQFGSAKLQEAGETERTRDHHLAFYLKLAEEAEPHLEGSDQITWANRLELEHDNLRAAVDWSRTAESTAELGLLLTGSLAYFWQWRGYFSEGREHLSAALSRPEASERTAARAKALYEAGRLAYVQGDFPAAGALLEESLSIYRELGPASRLSLAHALIMLGDTETGVGNYTTAVSVIEEGLDIMRELEEESGIVRALWKLGWCTISQGDYEHASQYFAEGLTFYRQIGDKDGLAMVLAGLGEVMLRQDDYGGAAELLEESLTLRHESSDKWGIAASLGTLGWVALRRDDLEQAVIRFGESLTLRHELGDRGGIAWCLEKLAEISVTKGQREFSSRRDEDFQRAARLFGAAEALRAPVNSAIDLVDQPEYERQLAMVRAQLDGATFTVAWAEGQAMTLEQAIEYVLAVDLCSTTTIITHR